MAIVHLKLFRASEGISERTLNAPSIADATQQVVREGFKVISVEAEGVSTARTSKRFPLVLFSTELQALLNAGLNIIEALEVLCVRSQTGSSRIVLQQLQDRLAEGLPLSRALEMFPEVFSALYIASIRASERTGNLSEALSRYLAYRNQLDSLKKKLVGVAIYPSIIIATGLAVMLFLLGYVVPRFSQIYVDLGDKLPAGTKWLIWWGQLVSDHGLLMLTLFGAVIVGAIIWLLHPTTRTWFIQWLWQLPWIGERLRLYQLARFYRTLSMLQRGGIPFVQALNMAATLLPQAALADGLALATRQIEEGLPIASTMTEHGLTDEVSRRLLAVGERNGNLGEMMERIANFYDEELGKWVELVSRMFEPILMAVVGVLIGAIVLMMYLPIFELAGSLQ